MNAQQIYNLWEKSNKVSQEYKNQMKSMSQEEIDIYFSPEKMHFGTAGIRGTMGPGTQRMNQFVYQQFTVGYAKYLLKYYPNNPSVVIGHDNRINSKEFSIICTNVLTSYGIKVYLFENNHLTPTPMISYTIRNLSANGGIIITASHNPKEFNGYKVYNPDGGQVLPNTASEIESLMPNPWEIIDLDIKPNDKLIRYIDEKIIDTYMEEAKQAIVNKDFITKNKTYPVIITTHHGTASGYLQKFLSRLNVNAIEVKEQCYESSTFEHSPNSNPEYYHSFDLAIELAKKENSNIIIGVDPDADRMAVMIKHNNEWKLMSGNDMGIIYTYYILNNRSYQKTPFIVSSYVSTNYIDIIAKEKNAIVYRTGTGFKWMGNCVSENDGKQNFVVAFEEAIGALCTTINRDKDSFTAAALALEIYDYCLENKMDLIDYLHNIIFKKYGIWFGKTDSFIIKDLDWKNIAIKKMQLLTSYPNKNIGKYEIKNISFNKIGDCLEWDLGNMNWIKFRMSGTEPKFKAYYNFYGKSLEELDSIYTEINQELKKIIEQ